MSGAAGVAALGQWAAEKLQVALDDLNGEFEEGLGARAGGEISEWRFEIPMVPVAKGRARAVRRSTGVAMITPTKTREWEATIAAFAASAMPPAPLDGPLRVDILAVMPRPQSLMGKKHDPGLLWAPKRPDADNIRKAVLDGMQSRWRDDGQVCAGDTQKVYAEKDGAPRVVVRVRKLMGRPFEGWLS